MLFFCSFVKEASALAEYNCTTRVYTGKTCSPDTSRWLGPYCPAWVSVNVSVWVTMMVLQAFTILYNDKDYNSGWC